VLEDAPAGGLVPRGDTLVRQLLGGADLRYEPGKLEVLTEYYVLRNDAQLGVGDGGAYTAHAWFAQLGYHVNRRLSAWYRYERLNYDAQDVYFTTVLGRDATVAERRNVYCLRYDLSESNALKLEAADRPRALDQGGVTWNFTWEFLMF